METPVQDATARGLIAAALIGVLTFLQVEYNLFSEEGSAALVPVAVFVAFFLGGLYDRFVRPRL